MKQLGAQPQGRSRPPRGVATELDSRELLRAIDALRSECISFERTRRRRVGAAHESNRESARNLLHYLAVRREDRRELQRALAERGLSSIGRSEAHTLATLDAVSSWLRLEATTHRTISELNAASTNHAAPRKRTASSPSELPAEPPISVARGNELLARAADRLLAPSPPGRTVRVMVTLPTHAADDTSLVGRLLDAGMSVARINTAHDTPEHWRRMTANVRTQAGTRGAQCRILFDLAGPKIRTGPIEPGPRVVRIKPERDALGRVVSPAIFTLIADSPDREPPYSADAIEIPVSGKWLTKLRDNDRVEFNDTRGRSRTFIVTRSRSDLPGTCIARGERTAYIATGTRLRVGKRECVVGTLPALEQGIKVHIGDEIKLTRSRAIGKTFALDRATTPTASTSRLAGIVGCTLPSALRNLKPGHTVWFDDGKIGGTVARVAKDSVFIRITDAPANGATLRADKGINLPDTTIAVDGLAAHDRAALAIAAKEADMVGLSFVQQPGDVRRLARSLKRLGGGHVGIVLKIETRLGFENLPELLFEALESEAAGVMIARGDLAVEMGYQRLSEVQEEILWLCEAAHVPVIWATQVLETLAKTGRPSRAEVTDAAMAVRAECVMLNKGPFVVEAVEFLDGVLRRMQEHQTKKSPMLRALSIARGFA
jgi:pyruvate kinase